MYESRTSCMGHELSTIYNTRKDVHQALPQRSRTAVYEPHTTYMSAEKIYMWVTNHIYESRIMYMSHELSTIYNTRNDIHEVLPQRSRTAVYKPHTTCVSAALYIWVTDYTYESQIMCTIQEPHIWVTNDAYQSRTIHDIQQHQEGCTRGTSATRKQYCSWAVHYIYVCLKIRIYVCLKIRMNMSHEWCIWVTNSPRYTTTPGRMYTRHFRNAAALLFMTGLFVLCKFVFLYMYRSLLYLYGCLLCGTCVTQPHCYS